MTQALEKHFVIDIMLGKLAKWLRILGFDARYEQIKDQEQIDAYSREGFLLVTRNRKLCGQERTFYLTANDPFEQLRQVALHARISPYEIRLFQRCIRCNDLLLEVAREDVFGHVPDHVFETHTSFHQCPNCRRIYWPGSHPNRVVQRLRRELGWSVSEDSAEC